MSKRYGIGKEREVRKILERMGYVVTRSSASLGMFDLIAVNNKRIRLIQVKATKSKKVYMNKEELDDIRNFQNYPKFVGAKEIWKWEGRKWNVEGLE